MENVRNRLGIKCTKDDGNSIKRQRVLNFDGCKQYDDDYVFTYKKIEVLFDKPIYLGFSVLEISKLFMYESYYDRFLPYFGEKNLQLHYMDCDSFVLSIKTNDIIGNLKDLKELFDFSNLDKNHELFDTKNKKVIGKFKIETPSSIWLDEFCTLRSKVYAFKCGNDNKVKLKGITKQAVKNMIIIIVYLIHVTFQSI